MKPAASPRTNRPRFEVCNGDADGLCAVVQWRLHAPAEAVLFTGLKREIELLERVPALAGDEVLVCDISMQRNHAALLALLERGARVRYFDHHVPGVVPEHPGLEAHIQVHGGMCTSALVDRHLQGRWRAWAAVGAYGDNLRELGTRLATQLGLSAAQCERLRALGEAINYNAYGESESDVCIPPPQLLPLLARYADPLEFAAREPIAHKLEATQQADMAHALAEPPYWESPGGAIYVLADAPWSRRVIGSFANRLASTRPERAHAVARRRGDGTLLVSVRAPLTAPRAAHELCQRHGGAGRAAAAGIDHLPETQLDAFARDFATLPWDERAASQPAS